MLIIKTESLIYQENAIPKALLLQYSPTGRIANHFRRYLLRPLPAPRNNRFIFINLMEYVIVYLRIKSYMVIKG